MNNAVRSAELGDCLARLVWENFSDLLDDGAAMDTTGGATIANGLFGGAFAAEELLILVLWLHTRACQQAFAGRTGPEELRAILDTLHASVFEDLEAHGVARAELPLFEQRVSARYSEYYAAASHGSGTVGEAAARHASGSPEPPPALSAAVAEATTAIARPLRDFLEEVKLED